MDIEAIVKEKIAKFGIPGFNSLRPYLQKQLCEIETYLLIHSQNRLNSIKVHSENQITIKGVADGTSVSKATIYNNPEILKKYIERSILEYDRIEEDYFKWEQCNKLEDENRTLKKILSSLEIELIKLNNLKVDNERLQSEITKHIYNENVLLAERSEFVNEINRLRRTKR